MSAPTHVIVAIDVACSSIPERPVAAVRRIGGGDGNRYRVLVANDPLVRDENTGLRINHDFDSMEEALEFADGIAALVDADPTLHGPHAAHAHAMREVAEENAREAAATHAAKEAELLDRISKLEKRVSVTTEE